MRSSYESRLPTTCVALAPLHGVSLLSELPIAVYPATLLVLVRVLGPAKGLWRIRSNGRLLRAGAVTMSVGLLLGLIATESVLNSLPLAAGRVLGLAGALIVAGTTSASPRVMVQAYIGGTAASVSVAVAQVAFTEGSRFAGLAGQPNELGLSAVFCLALGVSYHSLKRDRVLLGTAVAVAAPGVVLSGSRMAIGMVGLLAIMHGVRQLATSRPGPLLAVVAASTLTFAAFADSVTESQVISRSLGSDTSERADGERAVLNIEAQRIAVDSLPFGAAFSTPERSHNAFVKIGIHAGLVGLVGFAGLAAFVGARALAGAVQGQPSMYGAAAFFALAWATTLVWDPLLWMFLATEARLIDELMPARKHRTGSSPANRQSSSSIGLVRN